MGHTLRPETPTAFAPRGPLRRLRWSTPSFRTGTGFRLPLSTSFPLPLLPNPTQTPRRNLPWGITLNEPCQPCDMWCNAITSADKVNQTHGAHKQSTASLPQKPPGTLTLPPHTGQKKPSLSLPNCAVQISINRKRIQACQPNFFTTAHPQTLRVAEWLV